MMRYYIRSTKDNSWIDVDGFPVNIDGFTEAGFHFFVAGRGPVPVFYVYEAASGGAIGEGNTDPHQCIEEARRGMSGVSHEHLRETIKASVKEHGLSPFYHNSGIRPLIVPKGSEKCFLHWNSTPGKVTYTPIPPMERIAAALERVAKALEPDIALSTIKFVPMAYNGEEELDAATPGNK